MEPNIILYLDGDPMPVIQMGYAFTRREDIVAVNPPIVGKVVEEFDRECQQYLIDASCHYLSTAVRCNPGNVVNLILSMKCMIELASLAWLNRGDEYYAHDKNAKDANDRIRIIDGT